MTFGEYQAAAQETAIYPSPTLNGQNVGFVYPALGLAGEAGEIAEKCKKILRDKNGIVSDEDKLLIKKEIGDQIWYIAALCKEFGLSMDEVAVANIDKLRSRKERGVIQGSGDNR